MHLTKDTNHIRIILHELSGDGIIDAGDYDFSIEAANDLMAYDNTLLGDTRVTYLPWAQFSDQIGVGKIDVTDGSLQYVKGAIADLSVGRMMEAHQNDMMLTITGSEGNQIARVPLLQYALMSREYYEMAYGHTMPDQEFLDRQDEYVFTFFLDASQRWSEMHINILSWRVVVHNYGADSGDRS